jgi:hypothetical protein
MSDRSATPPAFLPPKEACAHLGISRSRLYRDLTPLHPGVLVRLGGRTLVDVARLTALISNMPRGPRRPLTIVRKGRRRSKAG